MFSPAGKEVKPPACLGKYHETQDQRTLPLPCEEYVYTLPKEHDEKPEEHKEHKDQLPKPAGDLHLLPPVSSGPALCLPRCRLLQGSRRRHSWRRSWGGVRVKVPDIGLVSLLPEFDFGKAEWVSCLLCDGRGRWIVLRGVR